ncbi:unnamed protein product [Effrenium voratum]|nr:unnamed protein product [Effrenium voratum]
MAGASATDVAPKVFSGETEDAREYKRWKTWVSNKLLTLDTKVPEAARGAYVYTLLSGKALESIEHLEPAEYQKKGGEQVIFQILDARFPQKDVSDEMSETLTAVFGLRAQEGESLKVWIARAGELFDSCHRKCKVTFPDKARGWLILNRSGLNEEQKAVVLARSNGSLKREDIGKAMRSCYPDYAVAKRRSVGAGLVESGDLPDDALADDSDPLVEEMEAFLAEFVAEALAVSWKDKRKELNKLQRSRRFGAAQDLKRSYRVEIEVVDVAAVPRLETFVAAVEWSSSGVLDPDETLLELVRTAFNHAPLPIIGGAVGQLTWVNHFKFGNGQRESTDTSVKLYRSALQALQAVVNFGTNEMSLFEDQLVVPMTTNAAGQYVINVLDHQLEKPSVPFAEVMMSVKDDHEVEPTVEVVPPAEAIAVPSDAQTSPEDDPAPAPVVPEAGPCPLPPVASPPDGQGDIEAVPPESVLVAYYLQKKTSKELPPSGNELHRLLAKAKAANAPDEFAEFSQYDPNNGVLQNPLTGETLNVWECGAMTDGSKRREDFAGDETPSSIKRQAKPKAKNMSGLGGDRNRGQPSYAMLFDEETQVPFPQASRPGDVAGSVLPPFPEGIPDLETWGKTVICFGQYKNQNMTYMDLVMATDNKALGYVKWCKSHSKSAQGHLKDLCNFMMHHSADEGISFGVFIPGTTQTRVLRE